MSRPIFLRVENSSCVLLTPKAAAHDRAKTREHPAANSNRTNPCYSGTLICKYLRYIACIDTCNAVFLNIEQEIVFEGSKSKVDLCDISEFTLRNRDMEILKASRAHACVRCSGLSLSCSLSIWWWFERSKSLVERSSRLIEWSRRLIAHSASCCRAVKGWRTIQRLFCCDILWLRVLSEWACSNTAECLFASSKLIRLANTGQCACW